MTDDSKFFSQLGGAEMGIERLETRGGASQTRALDLDESGFMQDPNRWNKSAARILAEMHDVGQLTPDHWAIIYYLREHHLSYGSLPPMSQVCRTRGLETAAVQRLFGGCVQAWRIAGLPDPGEEARTHMA
jgi:tRNA 2-thiouridine synthesizing protein E